VARPRGRRKNGRADRANESVSSQDGGCGGGESSIGGSATRGAEVDGTRVTSTGAVVASVIASAVSSRAVAVVDCPRRRPSRRPFWERNASTLSRLGTQTNRLPHGSFRPRSSPFLRSVLTVWGVVPSASAASATVRSSAISERSSRNRHSPVKLSEKQASSFRTHESLRWRSGWRVLDISGQPAPRTDAGSDASSTENREARVSRIGGSPCQSV
jgi:hypothetical protein